MNAFQIMEEIINELNDSTIDSMVGKRLQRVEDFDKKFKNSSNPLQLVDRKYQLENELKRAVTASDMRKTNNPEFKEFLKNRLAQYRERANAFKEASDKKGSAEMTGEALEIMEAILDIVEGRKEGESIEDYKNRLAGEQSEIQHKKYVDALSKLIYSEQHDKKHGYKFPRENSQRTQNLEKKTQKQYNNFNKAADIQLKNAGFDVENMKRKSQEDMIGQDYHGLKAEMRADNKAHEALEIMEAILDAVTPIFELDYENKQNVNTNKIRKLKKDKDGENVEVVSVADELFPYEGNAKQQFNQKVLAKINDMIEGKGSLEDLIQFVRKYSGNKKVTNEQLHEAMELMEDLYSEIKSVHGEPKYEGSDSHPANKSAELLDKMDKAKYQERKEAVAREKKPEETLEQATYRVLGRRDPLDTASGKQDSIVKYKKSGHEGVNPSSLKEALEEIKQVVEGLFVKDGRGDLLNDIDNALGSPVKKTVKDMVKQCTGCKQKKVNEAVELMEEIINELNDSTVDNAYVKRMDNYDNAEKAYKEATARYDKDIENIRAKYSDEAIVNGKADAELDKAAEKVEPYQKALYVADKKFDNMYRLYKNREQRKQGK